VWQEALSLHRVGYETEVLPDPEEGRKESPIRLETLLTLLQAGETIEMSDGEGKAVGRMQPTRSCRTTYPSCPRMP
jgi:hypothetical protein